MEITIRIIPTTLRETALPNHHTLQLIQSSHVEYIYVHERLVANIQRFQSRVHTQIKCSHILKWTNIIANHQVSYLVRALDNA